MSVVAGLIPVTQKASNVCTYCRVRKQRCDRTLPRCQRCAMKERHCDYTPFKEPMRPEDDDARPLVERYKTCAHADLTLRGASELIHATATWASSSGAPPATSKLSEVVYDILDLADVDLSLALAEFGPCIQQWCPVFPTSYLRGGVDDLARQVQRKDMLRHPLLLLCLWLVTRRTCVQEDHITQCQLYHTLKQIPSLFQPGGHIRIETLQISMLLTIYEVGHGMSTQAFQTMSTSVSMLKLLDLDAISTISSDTAVKRDLEWLKSSILMLDNTLAITTLSPGFPLTIHPSDPLSLSIANTLAPTIPPPPPATDATSPRKVHIRSAVAISASHVLSHLHTLAYNLAPCSSYTAVDTQINRCINLLIDKPQPHTWLHCDAIALAFCSHILLQVAQTRYLHSSMATATPPPPPPPSASASAAVAASEHTKAHLALSVSRRMAWDMVRKAIQVISSEEEIAELPFAGLCCVVRAGVAVLETTEWVNEGANADAAWQEEELSPFRRLVEWFGRRWGVGKGYLVRVDEVLARRAGVRS